MSSEEIGVSIDGHVATVELRRPPNNFLDIELIGNLATALEGLDKNKEVRSIVLASAGKQFCAGANLIKRINDEAAGAKTTQPRRVERRGAHRRHRSSTDEELHPFDNDI
jgi:enoyl-CoA hydratase/carnithine racemase